MGNSKSKETISPAEDTSTLPPVRSAYDRSGEHVDPALLRQNTNPFLNDTMEDGNNGSSSTSVDNSSESPSSDSQPQRSKHVNGVPKHSTLNTAPVTPLLMTRTESRDSVAEAYSNFSKNQKRMVVSLVSLAGLFSPLSANIYFPALNAIQYDLGVTAEMVNLTIFTYMIFQAISPSLWGSLADVWGRRPVYICCFVIYIAACIGLALVQNYVGLLILRMLQAFGSSSVIAIGSGTIGDIATPDERGGYMGAFGMGPMVGPILGPVIGGVLAQTLGWRSIFWLLAIAGFVILIPILCFLPETLRALVGNGSGYANPTPFQYFEKHYDAEKYAEKHPPNSNNPKPSNSRFRTCPNPLQPLIYMFEKDVLLILLYNSLIYAVFYAVNTSMPYLFATIYGLNELQIGLTYIPYGLGCLIGTFAEGKIMDRDYQIILQSLGANAPQVKDKGKTDPRFPIEAARMRTLWIPAILFYIIVILYGWLLQMHVSLAAILVLQALIGYCSTAIFNVFSTLLIDLFPSRSASVTATNNFARCIFGAIATVVVQPAISGIGVGWTFTVFGIIVIVASTSAILEFRWGSSFRQERHDRQFKHARSEAEIARDEQILNLQVYGQ